MGSLSIQDSCKCVKEKCVRMHKKWKIWDHYCRKCRFVYWECACVPTDGTLVKPVRPKVVKLDVEKW